MNRFIVFCISALLCEASFAVSPGQIDDFEDGSVKLWSEGGLSPNPPTNISTGGPAGAGDNYLENESSGSFGAGGRMIMFNIAQWSGDYNAAGISEVRMQVRVFSGGPANMRLAFGASTGARFASTDAVIVPNDGEWHEIVLPIGDADLTLVEGSSTHAASMAVVTEMRIVSAGAPSWRGDRVAMTIGVDNIEAIAPRPPLEGIVAIADISGNGIPEIGVVVPGSTRVHIRDGSTDALITDIDFGNDDALQMELLPDLNSSGNPEIAILNEQASGQVVVQIRDTLTGAVAKNLFYGLAYQPVAMDVVNDYSGNALPEIAVLGSEAGTDAVRVQVQDAISGAFLDNVFLGTQSIAKDLVSVADTSGNGIPEIGILGVLKANDQVRMQMWDAQTSAFQSNVWFAKVYQPQSTITMPSINMNASDEIVAVGVDPVTQNIRVQVRDSDTTATLYNIWLGAVNEAVDIVLINDINSDGVADLAVLLKTPGGTGRVRVQSGTDGAFIRNLFFSAVENPVGLAVMPDYSGGGFEELAVLGENAGVRHVQILDTDTGTQVNRIDFP